MKSYLLLQSLDLVKRRPKILKTILNLRQILKVIQIVHQQALQTPLILVYQIPNFRQIISKH